MALIAAAEKRYRSVRCVMQEDCGIRLTPMPPDANDGAADPNEARVSASMLVNVDPGFGSIPVPVWLINFVLKVMAPYMHRMLCKLLRTGKYFGREGVYTSRMDGNRALYAFVRRRARAAVGLPAEPADGSAFPHVYDGPPQPAPTDGRQF